MDFIHPDKYTFSLVRAFVETWEEKCVLLSSYIRRKSEKIWVVTKGNSLSSVKDIFVVFYLDSTMFYCFSQEGLEEFSDSSKRRTLFNYIEKGLNGKKIKCISGEKKGMDFLISLFGDFSKKAFQINNYELMVSPCCVEDLKFLGEPLCNGDEIIRCCENDLDELFNIQKKYLQEEVAPKGKVVSDLEVSMTLRQILKNQLCLGIFNEGKAMAKANTNAIGFNWVQIGGVYTHPLYRRNSYASNLIFRICSRALKVNKRVCLFVKNGNKPAIALYKKLGFIEKDFYKISYFR